MAAVVQGWWLTAVNHVCIVMGMSTYITILVAIAVGLPTLGLTVVAVLLVLEQRTVTILCRRAAAVELQEARLWAGSSREREGDAALIKAADAADIKAGRLCYCGLRNCPVD